MYLCNKVRYGYTNIPAKPHQTVEDDQINFIHVYLEALSKWQTLNKIHKKSNKMPEVN